MLSEPRNFDLNVFSLEYEEDGFTLSYSAGGEYYFSLDDLANLLSVIRLLDPAGFLSIVAKLQGTTLS